MSMTVGMREFREGLASYVDQTEPVTVTRHGVVAGVFIPVARDRDADFAAYAEAAKKANAWLAELGLTEDEAVAEIAAMRKAEAMAVAQ